MAPKHEALLKAITKSKELKKKKAQTLGDPAKKVDAAKKAVKTKKADTTKKVAKSAKST